MNLIYLAAGEFIIWTITIAALILLYKDISGKKIEDELIPKPGDKFIRDRKINRGYYEGRVQKNMTPVYSTMLDMIKSDKKAILISIFGTVFSAIFAIFTIFSI